MLITEGLDPKQRVELERILEDADTGARAVSRLSYVQQQPGGEVVFARGR